MRTNSLRLVEYTVKVDITDFALYGFFGGTEFLPSTFVLNSDITDPD